jgi:glycosyltransferase involved in cell wall biosynthesis
LDDGELAAAYRCCRLLCYVPLAEGFGLPPLEAMAAGAPVVASPLPSTGEAAFVVDPLDVEAIAAGLLQVASDDAVRARLIEAGRAHAARHRWLDTAAAHAEIYAEVASR